MSETQGFEALQSLSSNPEVAPAEPKIDAQGRAYATGKRKNAVARVWIKPGKGVITINGRDQTIYFARPVLRMMIAQPMELADRAGQFDVVATVEGSGLSGQAGAPTGSGGERGGEAGSENVDWRARSPSGCGAQSPCIHTGDHSP